MNKYSLLVIDDLASERDTEYMNEIIMNIIDSRYRALFDSIIVVTDRRNLDDQITTNIRQFAQVGSIVGHADRSSTLKTHLENGKSLIISTMKAHPNAGANIIICGFSIMPRPNRSAAGTCFFSFSR